VCVCVCVRQDSKLLLGSVDEVVSQSFTQWQTQSVEDVELAVTLLYQLAEALPVCLTVRRCLCLLLLLLRTFI